MCDHFPSSSHLIRSVNVYGFHFLFSFSWFSFLIFHRKIEVRAHICSHEILFIFFLTDCEHFYLFLTNIHKRHVYAPTSQRNSTPIWFWLQSKAKCSCRRKRERENKIETVQYGKFVLFGSLSESFDRFEFTFRLNVSPNNKQQQPHWNAWDVCPIRIDWIVGAYFYSRSLWFRVLDNEKERKKKTRNVNNWLYYGKTTSE